MYTPARSADQAVPVFQEKQLDGIRYTLEIDRSAIGIADYLNFRLTVEVPTEHGVTFQSVDDKIGPFRVVSRHPLGPLKLDEQREQWIREYILEAEQTGEQTIPAIWVDIGGTTMAAKTGCALFLNCDRTTPPGTGSGEARRMMTDPVTIEVTSVVPPEASITAIKDIAAPIDLAQPPKAGTVSWLGPLVILTTLGLAGFAWWWRRHRGVPPTVPAQPAHEWALQALMQLQQRDLMSPQRCEAFYVELSSILRGYIARRFQLRALQHTSEELLNAMPQSRLPSVGQHDLLSRFLRHCDGVKFARHQDSVDDMQQSLRQVRIFVEQTSDDSAADSAVKGGTA
jgi:hypothetical protein